MKVLGCYFRALLLKHKVRVARKLRLPRSRSYTNQQTLMVQEGSCLLELYLGVFRMSFHTVSAQSNVHQCLLKSVEEEKQEK